MNAYSLLVDEKIITFSFWKAAVKLVKLSPLIKMKGRDEEVLIAHDVWGKLERNMSKVEC